MPDRDADTQTDMDDLLDAGGREEMAKDATRRATGFRGVEDERPVEDRLKRFRRDAAHQRRMAERRLSR